MNQTLQQPNSFNFKLLYIHMHIHKPELFLDFCCCYCFGLSWAWRFLLYWILLLFEKSSLLMYLVSMLGVCFLCTGHITCRPGRHHWSRQYHRANTAVIWQKQTF